MFDISFLHKTSDASTIAFKSLPLVALARHAGAVCALDFKTVASGYEARFFPGINFLLVK